MSIDRIAHLFQASELKWKFPDGYYRVPTPEEIDDAVMRAMDVLDGSDDLTMIEFGRMIVQKNGRHFDVYVHMHEVPIENHERLV